MAISKVDFFGKTLVDLTSDTVGAQSLKAGYTAHGADGELVEGVLGKKLTFRPGSTLRLNVELVDADGNPYTMAAGEVLKLHMWHGADTIDAESETTEVSVEVPADAPTRPWHWTLVLKQSAMNIMAALGDARCFDEGDISFEIVGVVDGSRKVSSSGGFSIFAYSSKITTLSDYWFESLLPRTIQALNATSFGAYTITQCSELRSLELPAMTTIGNSSLTYCDMVEHLELPALESAGNMFAYSCKRLKCIELPALKSLGHTCFAFGSSLRVVALPGDELCNVAAKPLYLCPFFTSARDNIGRIYVNDALVDDYKSATNWSAFADYIYPISEWDGSIPESKWDTDFAMWGGGMLLARLNLSLTALYEAMSVVKVSRISGGVRSACALRLRRLIFRTWLKPVDMFSTNAAISKPPTCRRSKQWNPTGSRTAPRLRDWISRASSGLRSACSTGARA